MTQENMQQVTDVLEKPTHTNDVHQTQQADVQSNDDGVQQEQIQLGDGTFIMGPGSMIDLRAIRTLLEKNKQFIIIVGENQIAQCDLYDEEVRMLKGVLARLTSLQINKS